MSLFSKHEDLNKSQSRKKIFGKEEEENYLDVDKVLKDVPKDELKPILRKELAYGAAKVLGGFKKGGRVKRTGMYKVHKGEQVMEKALTNKMKR